MFGTAGLSGRECGQEAQVPAAIGRRRRDDCSDVGERLSERTHASLRDAVKDADLRRAKLGGAYLFKADLSGADLRDADADQVDERHGIARS